jgi:hypothetical protein
VLPLFPNDRGNYTILKGQKLDILLHECRLCTDTEVHIHGHEQTHTYSHLCMEENLFAESYCKVTVRTAVAQWLRHFATNQKVAGSMTDGVMEFLIDINPSDQNLALGSVQPLTERSTRCISCGKMRPVRKADNLTIILCRCQEI